MDASPWGGLEPGHIAFCEARFDGWIAEPANAWSSLAYVAVGAYLALRARRSGQTPLLLVGVASALVGFGSFAFHATGTFVGEFVDESSMFLISALMVTLALRRVFAWDVTQCTRAFAFLVTSAMVVLASAHGSGLAIFATHIVTAIALEVMLWRRTAARGDADYGALKITIGVFAAAWGVWWLDFRHVACDPQNHVFGGHAVWHAMSAVALAFYQRFQEQFVGMPTAVAPSSAVARSPIDEETDPVEAVVESLRSIRIRFE